VQPLIDAIRDQKDRNGTSLVQIKLRMQIRLLIFSWIATINRRSHL